MRMKIIKVKYLICFIWTSPLFCLAIYILFFAKYPSTPDYYICNFHGEGVKVYERDHDISIYSWLIYEYSPESGNVVIGSWTFASYGFHCHNTNPLNYKAMAERHRCEAQGECWLSNLQYDLDRIEYTQDELDNFEPMKWK